MKSMGAYTAKIKAEVQGKTQKVQDTSHKVTTGIYRGVPRCGPQNYQQIIYLKNRKCCIPIKTLPTMAVLYAGIPGSPGNSSSQFITPEDLYADALGNLWVVEGGENDIRKFSVNTGLITLFTTIPGNVTAIVPYSVNFLVGDSSNSLIQGVTNTGVVSTFGSGLNLSTPIKLAIDSTFLYVVDRGNFVVKKISLTNPTSFTIIIGINGIYQPPNFASNNLLTAVSATSISMGQLQGICIDSTGKIYICENSANRILQYNPATGNIVLFAGNNDVATLGPNPGYIDGPAFSARFDSPYGLTVDNADNIYVADFGNLRIRKITQAGIVSTIQTPTLQGPRGVFCNLTSNVLYISDTDGSAIYSLQV